MGFFNKKKKQEDEFYAETDDLIVVFDDEKKTAVIERVSEIREGSVFVTGKLAVALEDLEITNGKEGRVFFYRAPTRSIMETQRLAALERSLVLQHITAYKPPADPNAMDLQKIGLMGLILVAFIVIGVSSCGM